MAFSLPCSFSLSLSLSASLSLPLPDCRIDAADRGWGPRTPYTTFESHVAKLMGAEIKRGVVELVMFNQKGRDPFETQQMMEAHCIWRYKGRSHWVLRDDIDEYTQPLGAFQCIPSDFHGMLSMPAIANRRPFWCTTCSIYLRSTIMPIGNINQARANATHYAYEPSWGLASVGRCRCRCRCDRASI